LEACGDGQVSGLEKEISELRGMFTSFAELKEKEIQALQHK
jgi:hypothetical protein